MIELDQNVEKVLAVAFLNEASGNGTALVDTFSSWMIGGFGVAVMILLSQYDSATKHIYVHSITVFVNEFIVSLFLVVIQKYINLLVSSASSAGKIALGQFEQFSFDRSTFDMDRFNSQIDIALLQPARWIVRRKRAQDDNFAIPTRKIFRRFQYQCFLVFFQAILLLISIFQITKAFHP